MPDISVAAPHRRPKIDFKKELETASRGMIMIHDHRLLIKLIVRMIVRKLLAQHAGMILFDAEHDAYVLSISRGERGVKIPSNFARFTYENPIIKLFTDREYKSLVFDRNAVVSDDINRLIWREHVLHNGNGNGAKELLHRVNDQMTTLNVVACVPAYYQRKLMAILLLGNKRDESKYTHDELDFLAALASDVAMALRNAQLFEGLQKEAERNRKLFIQTVTVLSSTIEAKDAYTHGHTERVTSVALAIARQMVTHNCLKPQGNFFENLHVGALLHDIGKIGIPESILLKPGELTTAERDIIQMHPVRGEEIIRPLNLPKECVDGIKYHHERYDGKGYPSGLKGEDIPISAAIISVADAFDAMITDRPYRTGLSRQLALEELSRHSGTQFNPRVVNAALTVFKDSAS